MRGYKVRRWCRKCKQMVTATQYMNYETLDGRIYESGVDKVICPICDTTDNEDYSKCSICGSSKGVSDLYCKDCIEAVENDFNGLREELGADVGDFKELVYIVVDNMN